MKDGFLEQKVFTSLMIEALNPHEKSRLEKKIQSAQKAVRLCKNAKNAQFAVRNLEGYCRLYTGRTR